MRRTVNKTILALAVLLLALMFSTASYAKLVVLSYTFDNNIQGFTANMQGSGSSCNASPVTSWGIDGTLVVTLAPASGCSGYSLSINKLVVLSSAIASPNLDMLVRDDGGALNLNGAIASLSSIASPSKLVVLSHTVSGAWTDLNGSWGAQANSGSATLQMLMPLSAGQWSVTRVIRITSSTLNNGK